MFIVQTCKEVTSVNVQKVIDTIPLRTSVKATYKPGLHTMTAPYLSHTLTTFSSTPDIDECSENSSLCGDHGVCINTPGSFNCSCDPKCHKDAICTKGLQCVCGEGYTGNGHNCTSK